MFYQDYTVVGTVMLHYTYIADMYHDVSMTNQSF